MKEKNAIVERMTVKVLKRKVVSLKMKREDEGGKNEVGKAEDGEDDAG
jgi:hypothetical protein